MKIMENKKLPNFVKAAAALLLIAAVAVSGCVDGGEENNTDLEPIGPTTGGDNTVDEGGNEEEFIYGTANVENIDIMILESFPVQVRVSASGDLPDGCTEIDEIQTEKTGNTFEVSISTKKPRDAICTQALVPFTETFPLEVRGLEAGTYTVDVNGVTGTFELETDNIIEEPFPEAGGNPSFTEADNGTNAVFENGTVFYLKLSENPTTGYSWELERSEGLNLLGDEYIQDEPPAEMEQPIVGAGGAHIWELEAVAKGEQQLTGIYKRPWEEETGEEDIFVLDIEVV
jgi:inhibitor of cysteine peptidase